MRQIIRLMGLCALVAFGATSCQKNEMKPTNTISAVLNQPTADGKTQIGASNYLVWSPNDQIMVGGTTLATQTFTAMSSGSTHTDFTGGSIDPNEPYWAFYPVNYVTNVDEENGRVTFTVPTTQTYAEGTFATNTYPMAASNRGSGTVFTFQGLFGVLSIPLTGSCTVGSIELTDAMFDLTGETTINVNDMLAAESGSGSKSNGRTVTLLCGDGVTLSSSPTVFMFALRPLALANGFTITIKDPTGEVITTRTVPRNMRNAIRPEIILQMPTLDLSVN